MQTKSCVSRLVATPAAPTGAGFRLPKDSWVSAPYSAAAARATVNLRPAGAQPDRGEAPDAAARPSGTRFATSSSVTCSSRGLTHEGVSASQPAGLEMAAEAASRGCCPHTECANSRGCHGARVGSAQASPLCVHQHVQGRGQDSLQQSRCRGHRASRERLERGRGGGGRRGYAAGWLRVGVSGLQPSPALVQNGSQAGSTSPPCQAAPRMAAGARDCEGGGGLSGRCAGPCRSAPLPGDGTQPAALFTGLHCARPLSSALLP